MLLHQGKEKLDKFIQCVTIDINLLVKSINSKDGYYEKKKILVLLTVVIYTLNFSFNVSAKSYNVDDEL